MVGGAAYFTSSNAPQVFRVAKKLHLGPNAATAGLVSEQPTDPDRVFTTAKLAQGRLLLVDSKFDENPVGIPPYQVVALDVRRS